VKIKEAFGWVKCDGRIVKIRTKPSDGASLPFMSFSPINFTEVRLVLQQNLFYALISKDRHLVTQQKKI
jgi:hypothetical protein